MVVAKLHIICGNCGKDGEFEHDIIIGGAGEEDEVFLKCKNCGTIHVLSDNSKLDEVVGCRRPY
jgi:uncharacterized Zn finger protein